MTVVDSTPGSAEVALEFLVKGNHLRMAVRVLRIKAENNEAGVHAEGMLRRFCRVRVSRVAPTRSTRQRAICRTTMAFLRRILPASMCAAAADLLRARPAVPNFAARQECNVMTPSRG
jgi:hypothetical protein